MKRIAALFLIAIFAVSLAGCVAKTEYEKLREEKSAVEKRLEDIAQREAELKSEIAARKQEIGSLREELKETNARNRELEEKIVELEK